MKALHSSSAVLAILGLSAAVSSAVWADAGHGHGESFGEPGNASDVDRTVEILMQDNLYEPDSITVSEGETIRFVVTNAGMLLHEFNIGSAEMHAAHQEEMMMMTEEGVIDAFSINHEMMAGGHGLAHDDPNSVLLEPGQSAELIWRFSEPAEIEFACNLPGHYQAGMLGHFRFDH